MTAIALVGTVGVAHADALPPVGLELGPACPYVEWLGVEPWYSAGHEVDWLGACVADAD